MDKQKIDNIENGLRTLHSLSAEIGMVGRKALSAGEIVYKNGAPELAAELGAFWQSSSQVESVVSRILLNKFRIRHE